MTEKPFADDKDWTWVLDELCTECEYDVREFEVGEIANLIADNAQEWIEIIAATPPERLTERPRPDRWSALEYACHVRDVFALYNYRLGLMLNEDGPHYPNWNQDQTAIDKDYNSSNPIEVAVELKANAAALARHFGLVREDDWERTGFRSDGAVFTIESFARYLMHDPAHHLWDVNQGLQQLAD